MNGVRFSKVEALGVKADLGQTLDANASLATVEVNATPATDHVHTFLLRSSWYGLKVLKACQWASKGKRILNLRKMCTVGEQMAFDYAFGYFIASISADALSATANVATGDVVVSAVHATLDQRITPKESYKKNTDESRAARRDILRALRRQLPWLEVPDSYADEADGLDSLIASLTARAAAQGLTRRPEAGAQADLTHQEGWIHLPTSLPTA